MKKIVIIFILMFIFTGCDKKIESIADVDFPKLKNIDNIKSSYHIESTTGIQMPGGFCIVDGEIYISDLSDGLIHIFDKDLNKKSVFKITGTKLVKPEVMIFHKDSFYVADNGSSSIMILNGKGQYEKELSLKITTTSGEEHLIVSDMEIIDNLIYISSSSPVGIYSLDFNNGEIEKITDNILGSITSKDKRLYAADMLQITDEDSDDADLTVTGIMGVNGIHELDNGEFTKLFNIHDYYAPADFVMDEDSIYIYSASNLSLIKLDSKGNPLELIWESYMEYKDFFKENNLDGTILRNLYTEDFRTFYLVFTDTIGKVELE